MAFPKKYGARYLDPAEEKELFSYIFAGILFENNISSSQLLSRGIGPVEAVVIQSYDIATICRSHDMRSSSYQEKFERDKWRSVITKNGDMLFIEPEQARALHIRFSSFIGVFSVYAEVSFKNNGYNLDNVLNIPNEWLRDLSRLNVNQSLSAAKKRILKIPTWGQRAMLIESDTTCILELPHVSNKYPVSVGYDYLKTPLFSLEDYLSNYPERAFSASRDPNEKFGPNNGA